MVMDTNKIILSYGYGKCRCCLTKGNHLDLTKEYINDGVREVYSEVFVDVFNLFLCTDARMTTLICMPCVVQLKNALQFKTKVLDSEKSLMEMLHSENGKLTVYFNNNVACSEVKDEINIKEEILHNNSNAVLDYESDGIDEDASSQLKGEIDEEINVGVLHQPESIDKDEELDFRERDLLSRFPAGSLQKLPTSSKHSNVYTLCGGYFRQLEKLKGKTITAKMLKSLTTASSEPNKDKQKPSSKTTKTINKPETTSSSEETEKNKIKSTSSYEKAGHIINISTLLTYSNLTAFKTKHKNGFPCFYCLVRFDSLELLRDHQKSHKKENLVSFVKKKYKPGRPDCLVVYAEVTNLKCTICEQSIPSLNDLKTHLINNHQKRIHTQYTDRVIPFKVSDSGYQCQICFFFFETFGTIEKHMNTHFRNFVCDECGAGFIARNRLKIHTYLQHKGIGDYSCDICAKRYTSRRKLKVHNKLIHKLVKNLKCPHCPLRFSYYHNRQRHLAEVHNVNITKYKCNACDKAFSRRFHLSNHIKKDHMNEKDWSCQLCSYSCFSKQELQAHMSKAHGERLYECQVCGKRYACLRSLKRHSSMH